MSMNKKIITFLGIVIVSLLLSVNVFAQDNCDIADEKICNDTYGCSWNSYTSECEEDYVANNPCGDEAILHILYVAGILLRITTFAAPLIIILFGMYDIFKAVIDKDEQSLVKQLRILLLRLIAGLTIFFLPTILGAIFGLSDKTTYDEKNMCAECVLRPTKGGCTYTAP